MRQYYCYINDYNLSQRKRFSKDYLYEGQVVAYSQIKESWTRYGTNSSKETGLLEIDSYSTLLPKEMKIYQATDQETAWVKAQSLKEDFNYSSYKEAKDLVGFLTEIIENDCNTYCRKKEWLFALPYFMEEADTTSFKQDIWNACKGKIGAIGLNFNREKTELYTILIAEAMIIGTDKSPEECVNLSNLLGHHWSEFSIMYSLFYGRNITTGHTRFIELLPYMLGKGSCVKYLHLMLIALGDPQQKIEKIMRYSPSENQQKLWEKVVMMQRQKDLAEQSHDLDELFAILFPSTFQQHLMTDHPYASIDEVMADVKESMVVKDMLKKVEEYANSLKEQLGNAIPIESLRGAILKCDPSTSRAIFAQLDMVLEGCNEVWDKHRLQLKKEVNIRYEQDLRLLTDQPKVVQISSGTEVKCEFNSTVGQVIGNVETLVNNNETGNRI